MKLSIALVGVALALLGGGACADTGGTVLFLDTFEAPAISPDWTVHEGKWTTAEGALTNTGGGLIALNRSPGSQFELETEANFPPNWMSLILFYESPDDYGTLYFGGGYWEHFEMDDGRIGDYVQHRDPEITPGVDHQVRVVANHGRVTLFYDGKLKGEADLRPRPGAQLAFRNLANGGRLKIKRLRITRPALAQTTTVRALQPADLAGSAIHVDYGLEEKAGATARLSGDVASGVELGYVFADGAEFETRFARIPLAAAQCRHILVDVEGDASRNKLFIILHDRSGEQHLVAEAFLSWQGWQEVAANLAAFVDSPPDRQRLHTRWGGDENQRIDFPLTAVDIGVAKRDARARSSGQVRFRNLRLAQ